MNPSSAPQFTPPQSVTEPQAAPASKRQFIWGLVCLLGPTALIVVSILIYALVNFIATSSTPAPTSAELFTQPSPVTTVMNVILFIVGGISVIAWLPGVIIGIILLATRKKHHA